MEAKHTPGPWKMSEYADSDGTKHVSVSGGGRSIVVATGTAYTRPGEFHKPDIHPTNLANARLIAAAPALLEACRAVQRDIDGFIMGEWESSEDGWKALSDRLYAAIAQAEGGGE